MILYLNISYFLMLFFNKSRIKSEYVFLDIIRIIFEDRIIFKEKFLAIIRIIFEDKIILEDKIIFKIEIFSNYWNYF